MMGRTLPRLSKTERTILEQLQAGELFGLQLVEDGTLKRGTVYVTLARMQQKRYVKSRQEPRLPRAIGLPRRWYSSTPYGRRVLEAWRAAERAYDEGERAGAA